MTYEHKQDMRPQDSTFPAYLDAQSEEGWELVALYQVGVVPVNNIVGANGRQMAVPLVSCVFRRVKKCGSHAITFESIIRAKEEKKGE